MLPVVLGLWGRMWLVVRAVAGLTVVKVMTGMVALAEGLNQQVSLVTILNKNKNSKDAKQSEKG